MDTPFNEKLKPSVYLTVTLHLFSSLWSANTYMFSEEFSDSWLFFISGETKNIGEIS